MQMEDTCFTDYQYRRMHKVSQAPRTQQHSAFSLWNQYRGGSNFVFIRKVISCSELWLLYLLKHAAEYLRTFISQLWHCVKCISTPCLNIESLIATENSRATQRCNIQDMNQYFGIENESFWPEKFIRYPKLYIRCLRILVSARVYSLVIFLIDY